MALLASTLALVLTLLLGSLMERSVFLLVLAAVMTSAWYGGLGPGLLATAVTTLASALIFRPPNDITFVGPEGLLRLSMFVVVAVLISALSAWRTRAEEAHSRLAALVEYSDDAIIAKTLDGVITSWNKGAEKLYGYSAEEAVGQHISMLAPPEQHDEIPDILESIRRGENIDHFETVRVTKDGRKLNISLTVSPVKNSRGDIAGASTIAHDITDRIRMEESLRYQAF